MLIQNRQQNELKSLKTKQALNSIITIKISNLNIKIKVNLGILPFILSA